MLIEKITCDVCGIQKGEVNHWIMVSTSEFTMPCSNGEQRGISFAPWNPDLYRNYRHLCGESCAGRLLARSIDEWNENSDSAPRLPMTGISPQSNLPS